jgi:hypothetical protein
MSCDINFVAQVMVAFDPWALMTLGLLGDRACIEVRVGRMSLESSEGIHISYTAPLFLKLGARCRWVFSFTPLPLYSLGKISLYPFIRRCLRLQ